VLLRPDRRDDESIATRRAQQTTHGRPGQTTRAEKTLQIIEPHHASSGAGGEFGSDRSSRPAQGLNHSIESVRAHHARLASTASTPAEPTAPGYRAETLSMLFGREPS
jgi:hypothetical protein